MEFNAGSATGKDEVLVDFSKEKLAIKLSTKDKETFYLLMENYGMQKNLIEKWYEELKKIDIKEQILPYNYRLFDKRFVIYNPTILQRARYNLMKHLVLRDNYALVTTRILSSPTFQHAFISDCIGDRCFISNRGQEANYFFPLYIYSESTEDKTKRQQKGHSFNVMMLFEPQEKYMTRKPNLNPALLAELEREFKKAPSPEEIFYYIYAVLYSNIYRTKYVEFLKIAFPRIPFTKECKLFSKMAEYGENLVELHLMKSKELEKVISRFQGDGDNRVEKLVFDSKKGILFINETQFFEGIPEGLWEYHIGGYQVLDKWLKDRKGRVLSLDEIRHYCGIVAVLNKTIEIQDKIDSIYPGIEKRLLNFSSKFSTLGGRD